MRNSIYRTLIEHVSKKNWSDAQEVLTSILEQKVALQLEAEKKLLTEPEDEVNEADEAPAQQKCKSCGKSFTPHNGEYSRCKTCFDKQTDAGERASSGRY